MSELVTKFSRGFFLSLANTAAVDHDVMGVFNAVDRDRTKVKFAKAHRSPSPFVFSLFQSASQAFGERMKVRFMGERSTRLQLVCEQLMPVHWAMKPPSTDIGNPVT